MMRYFLVFYIILYALQTQGQGVVSDDLRAREDSILKVREERFRRFDEMQKRRELYRRMLSENPALAMDSVVKARKAENLNEGLKRLAQLEQNTRPDTLKEIDLSYAGLDEIPDFVFEAKSLRILVLDYNHIRKLPKRLAELDSLKRVYWRYNELEDFRWIRVQNIGGIDKLDMSYNKLTRLPLGVKKIKGLKELILEENLFEEIPVNRLAKASWIETVSFNECSLLELARNNYGKLDFLLVFKANKCGLAQIDPSIYDMSGLVELQLQENNISSVPSGISTMENLSKLSFYKNNIHDLPSDFFDIPNLIVVDFYFNDLEVISEDIGNLDKLEILYLSNNCIYSLPESLGKLTNLEELYLHHNRLSTLPSTIESFKDLRVFRVNDNYLIDFPDALLNFSHLEDIDVSNNQITSMPVGLEHLKKLRLFTFENNPVDLANPENRDLVAELYRMSEAGTICVPRVSISSQ
ncbi:MAG: leucine-rich repeat domain-containing protein [Cyclobacteriaceae bacterium]